MLLSPQNPMALVWDWPSAALSSNHTGADFGQLRIRKVEQHSNSLYQPILRDMTTKDAPVVFIVDDDAGVRRSIQDLLSSVALSSEAFATPQEFLDRRHADYSGCLVLDVRLPGMSGLDFQRRLTEIGVTIPIIFITGHGD